MWMRVLGGLPAPRLIWNANHRDYAPATELHLFQLVQLNFGAVGTSSDHIPWVFLTTSWGILLQQIHGKGSWEYKSFCYVSDILGPICPNGRMLDTYHGFMGG